MKLKAVVQSQYRDIVNRAVYKVRDLSLPQEGWIRTVRKSLGMSAAQLAKRQGKTRASVSNMEKAELEGSVTINAMKSTAEALNCKFVYAIVPKEVESIESIMENQAQYKAEQLVKLSNLHMALEQQSLSAEKNKHEIDRLKKEMLGKITRDFWDDKSQ